MSDMPAADDLCKLLPLSEAAAHAQVSVRTVERWVAAGLIEPVDLGRAGRQKTAPWRYVDEQTVLETERAVWRGRKRTPRT